MPLAEWRASGAPVVVLWGLVPQRRWGAQTRSGCSLVFVDQSAEQVAAMDCNRRVGVAVGVGDGAVGRGELERPVGPVLVVVLRVGVQDSFEVAAHEDEDAIEAVGADC